MTLRTRHLLSIDDLNAEEAVRVLDVAEEMANLSNREVKKLPALRGRTVLNLFLKTAPELDSHSKLLPNAFRLT